MLQSWSAMQCYQNLSGKKPIFAAQQVSRANNSVTSSLPKYNCIRLISTKSTRPGLYLCVRTDHDSILSDRGIVQRHFPHICCRSGCVSSTMKTDASWPSETLVFEKAGSTFHASGLWQKCASWTAAETTTRLAEVYRVLHQPFQENSDIVH